MSMKHRPPRQHRPAQGRSPVVLTKGGHRKAVAPQSPAVAEAAQGMKNTKLNAALRQNMSPDISLSPAQAAALKFSGSNTY
jgi:hypothetical protein